MISVADMSAIGTTTAAKTYGNSSSSAHRNRHGRARLPRATLPRRGYPFTPRANRGIATFGSRCAPRGRAVLGCATFATPCVDMAAPGHLAPVFLFFSTRLGCIGSLALSVLLSLLLLWIFHVI
jgi:hypothetical protein